MPVLNSSHTGRAPRTLEAAFGPYTSAVFIEHEPAPMRTVDVVIYVLLVLSVVFVVGLIALERAP